MRVLNNDKKKKVAKDYTFQKKRKKNRIEVGSSGRYNYV